MRTSLATSFACAALLGWTGLGPAPVQAQTAQDPLSAIDWLSDVVRADPSALPKIAKPKGDDVATSATATQVTTMTLGQLKLDAVGLLPRASTGLPADFWARSSVKDLVPALRNLRGDLPPPLAQFLTTLLLAELPAPVDSTDGAEMFLARVDKFLELGALDQAQALLARAGPTRPLLFGRWFDVSLLTGQEDQACTSMLQTPAIAPTYPARVLCLARTGDWDAAAVTLNTGKALGVISDKEDALLARFLDPELFEGEPFLPVPDRITPLSFRMHEAIGEPLSLGGLPHAFAYRGLSDTNGWKARLSAAERLVRTGAVAPDTLFSLYAERGPAASGGVWDRARAVQDFDAALASGDAGRIAQTLTPVMRTMRSAGLEHAFSQSYGPKLISVELTGRAAQNAARAAFMSKDYEIAAGSALAQAAPALWSAVAKGQTKGQTSDDALEAAILAGLGAMTPPTEFAALLGDRRLGEVALLAIGLMADGARSDPANVERGLAALSQMGLEDVARQTALHMLLTRPRA